MVNVVDDRVQTAIHILEASSLHGLSDADGISDLRGQAVKFLASTLGEWNGEKLATDVQVYLGGDLQFQRWHAGDSQGGICPAKKDAAAVIRALEEALDNARRITCLDFQTAWDGAPIPGEPLPFATVPPGVVQELTEAVIGPGVKPTRQSWKVGDIVRLPSHSGCHRVWRVIGIFLGGLNQESVIELETLDRMTNTEGRMCVPVEILESLKLS